MNITKDLPNLMQSVNIELDKNLKQIPLIIYKDIDTMFVNHLNHKFKVMTNDPKIILFSNLNLKKIMQFLFIFVRITFPKAAVRDKYLPNTLFLY